MNPSTAAASQVFASICGFLLLGDYGGSQVKRMIKLSGTALIGFVRLGRDLLV
jgi:hypothetical protein